LEFHDGHLRRDLDSNMEVDVNVLDGSDEKGRTLLLSIDPLAALAQTQERLMELAPPISEELQAAWRAEAESRLAAVSSISPEPSAVPCRDEQHQVEVLSR
jgi:hypothetical protein